MLDAKEELSYDEAAAKIIVALDCSEQEALSLAESLKGKAQWLKIGMTLYYAAGPAIVKKLKDMGFKLFLDLKLHDIPHQVRGAAQSVASLGVDIVSCHALGGAEMIAAAKEGLSSSNKTAKLICITVLTSTDAQTLRSIGICTQLEEQVDLLARLSAEVSDGIVCSPQEAALMRKLLGDSALIVTPGVRPHGDDLQDQSRVCTPAQAIERGASLLVIGRPITQASDPRAKFDEIVNSIRGVG